MMLVQLPAIDAVAVSVRAHVPSSWPLPLPQLPVPAWAARPAPWLALLATVVILASIRAALLLLRPPHPRKPLSLVAQQEKPAPAPSIPDAAPAHAPAPTPQTPPTSSWLWGLVRWEALPALPVARGQGWAHTLSPASASHQQQQQRPQEMEEVPRGRRGPAFDHPLPALYVAGPPVSMAKMIMSRHTFRRPSSRPPPVRNANAVQYQRRAPSMV